MSARWHIRREGRFAYFICDPGGFPMGFRWTLAGAKRAMPRIIRKETERVTAQRKPVWSGPVVYEGPEAP